MKYYIIAGEASGDLHGSNLMKGLYKKDPEAEIRFWGGDLMHRIWIENEGHGRQDIGGEDDEIGDKPGGGLVRHYRKAAVMGFAEVLAMAGRLLGNLRFCKKDIVSFSPDCIILIDYPGFNFRIAEFAHKRGFKVFYYIAPKVWASREGRIRKLKEYVDRLYIIFPFEIPYFESKGVRYIYKGNPLVDAVDSSDAVKESRQEFLNRNSLEDKPIIAMLAGSRNSEITTMMPVLVSFAIKMHSLPAYAGYQFIIAGAPARDIRDYSKYIPNGSASYIKVIFSQTQSIVRQAEAAVVNSGTASLETVLLGTPQVVGFIMGSSLTYRIAKHIVKVKYISLGNLIVNKLAFKEFIQNDCNPDALVNEVRRLMEDLDYRNAMLADYAEIRRRLGGQGASEAVAASMIEEIRHIGDKRTNQC